MDVSLIFEIVKWALIIVLGLMACYFRAREDIVADAKEAIVAAEDTYKDATKAGGVKFEYAVDWIYDKLPTVFKLIVSKSTIAVVVQNTFDVMEDYVFTQMDKVARKILPNSNSEEGLEE